MLVRIKKSCGNYGLVRNGVIEPKNFASGAFEVSEQEGDRMLQRGIAEAVNDESAAEAATPSESPDSEAKVKKPRKSAKKETTDVAPTVNAVDSVV